MEESRLPETVESADLRDLTRLLQGSEGFEAVLAAVHDGHAAAVDGAWNSSASLACATLIRNAPQGVLIVLAHPRDLDDWSEDLLSFTGQRTLVFPAFDALPDRDTLADETATQRLRLIKLLEEGPAPSCLLTTLQALMQPVPDRSRLAARRRKLEVGATIDPDELAKWLVQHGFQRRDVVELPLEFSRRGGIMDVYSADADSPCRVEFFGDEVASLRQFSPATQRSLGEIQSVEILAATEGDEPDSGRLFDYLPERVWCVLVEPGDLHEQGKHYLERVADPRGLFSMPSVFAQLTRGGHVTLSNLPGEASAPTVCHLRAESVERFSGDVTKLRDELDNMAEGDRVLIACHNEAERKRLSEVLSAGQLAQSDRLQLALGRIRAGFRLMTDDAGAVVVLGDHELFHRDPTRPVVLPRRRLESKAIDSFLDLQEDDLVVHVSHGIARFRGMQMLDKNGHTEEHLILEFREGTRVFVPVSKIDLVQKYVGGGNTDPELSKLGGVSWQRRKERVEAAVLDLAGEMIDLQALREAQPGLAVGPDTEWQAEFEAAFPYEETPDQLTSLVEIKRDMQRPRPMDRLICGDVGYGKTELAVRAAFKAMDNGRQVAVLVPTTVLAEQHYRTFSQRLAAYPFVVEQLSRFRSPTEQRRVVERLARGGVDCVIGTHRILSADIRFKDLGLVVIDEEQRFGVEHKERLKRLRQMVDVLTLTATPIPRTLHLSLLGIRDISNLETPPRERMAIETRIVRFDKQLIRHAILRELNREGQIYFVHNRVYNIQEIADRLASIVPEARICIAHGQMNEHELEDAMMRFLNREADILVATTIIESGLDIPNVNTIFINQAENYGLADLHQLRGRVGRYKHRAYAYLLLDENKSVTSVAAKRLKAIEEFSELGAGFKIAMRDLEIRGAGNILGPQQSGHIAAVGYELYCQLLENAVRGLKKQPLKTPLEVTVDLPWPAFLPRDYVASQRGKIEVYRRLARIRRAQRIDDFRQELRDRFGEPPEPAQWLLRLAELRVLAAAWQVETVHLEKSLSGPTDVVLGYRNPRRIRRLADLSKGRLRVVDDHSAYYRLEATEQRDDLALFQCLKTLLRPGEPTV
jgi:transcription-repair coupling factor (superfamily II helicase)